METNELTITNTTTGQSYVLPKKVGSTKLIKRKNFEDGVILSHTYKIMSDDLSDNLRTELNIVPVVPDEGGFIPCKKYKLEFEDEVIHAVMTKQSSSFYIGKKKDFDSLDTRPSSHVMLTFSEFLTPIN